MIEKGLWKPRAQKDKPVYVWRERRSAQGELIQIDGSHHRWLEDRLFGTLQDRLIKEMRLANVCSIEDANTFLESYLPKFNKRFSVRPKESVPLWRQPDSTYDPQWTFVRRYTRTILNDYTIRWNNKLFLVQNPTLSLKKQRVEIRQAMDGQLRFTTKNKQLTVEEVQAAPKVEKPMSMSEAKRRLSQALDDGSPKKSWMDNFHFGQNYKSPVVANCSN